MKKDAKETEVINWQIVSDCLAEKTVSGYKMALIEADKLLEIALKKAGYPGKNIEEKINSANALFSNYKSLKKSREKRNTVLNELSYNLNSIEVEEALKNYHQALIDIENNPDAKLSLLGQILAKINYLIPSKKDFVKKITIYFLSILLLILFLSDTNYGKELTGGIVSFSRFLFSWVLTAFVLMAGVVTIITLSILYFERKRKNTKQEFEL